MGPAARTPDAAGGGDPASRARDSHVPGKRGRARGAARAGTGEGSDSEVMKRREFVTSVGRTAGLAGGSDLLGFRLPLRPSVSPFLFIPTDESQSDHLQA